MAKISGKCLKSGLKDGKFMALIQLNGKIPKPGDLVTVKWGKIRSLSQNALLWCFYDWLMNQGGLKDEYATAEELHETLKAAFLSQKHFTPTGKEILKIGSSTELGKIEFGEFIEKINQAMIEWNGIDTSPFWSDYQSNFGANL